RRLGGGAGGVLEVAGAGAPVPAVAGRVAQAAGLLRRREEGLLVAAGGEAAAPAAAAVELGRHAGDGGDRRRRRGAGGVGDDELPALRDARVLAAPDGAAPAGGLQRAGAEPVRRALGGADAGVLPARQGPGR